MKNKDLMCFTVIGINDSRQPFLTDKEKEIIAKGKVFSGGKRHHDIVSEYLPEESRWIDITVPLAGVFEQYRGISGQIVVFASGDPLFFGFANTLKREFPNAAIEVLPTFNSLQTLAHRMVMPYHDMTIVSLTGRPWKEFDAALIERRNKIGVLTDHVHTPAAIARRMLDYGYSSYDMTVGEHLGNPETERTATYSIEEVSGMSFESPNCVIITGNNLKHRIFGIPDEMFVTLEGRPGMITKMPIRLLSLQALDLPRRHTLWDIGFCTGSISIEAKGAFPRLDIVAFEKRHEGRRMMEENCRRMGTPGIQTVIGDFNNQDLTQYSCPDAVFIGGHGGQLTKMLAKTAERLLPGGCIVMNSVTAESRHTFEESCKQLNLTLQPPIYIKLNDYNPIEILKCVKP